ncbi:uncharacterized protein LTR77_000931 [Saxophila tyrrhenica]|uniref:Gfo/Idh/MocA-like oxidoreductase N-terminal domain-containing protein n=1 Tax=Saxophila tyrrhenica TaxID=1690608 RepID=A0AAV9PPW1_9PEZI|nr:hypothetical protein LTR77_000931 [Saxophila tyrrhenica]
MAKDAINVGIIGCGEVARIIHIPTLNHMSDYFRITYLCDVSHQALEHCRGKVSHFSPDPKTTTSAAELCNSPDVEVVFVLSSNEFHVSQAILALRADKHVFIEKPMAMNERDLALLREAEQASKGTVMVGYMRRFAPAYINAVMEIGGMDKICYAVVRDIIGSNALFTPQSGTFAKYFSDYGDEASKEREKALAEMYHQGLEVDLGVPATDGSKQAWALLGGLGSHDLSAMREALGMPDGVVGCSINMRTNFWNAMFKYPTFTVHYESGIHDVPIFDAFIEVFGNSKQVKIKWDTPYIKGLPVTMTVREDADGTGALREIAVRKTYEDPYTAEMRELYGLIREGKKVKTTVEDAANDLKLFQMIMKAGAAQVSGG